MGMGNDHTHDLSSSHNASSPIDLNLPLTALVGVEVAAFLIICGRIITYA